MCTVSFVPIENGYCITSNRDESIKREKAIPPKKYIINQKEIYFPKDPRAGGTWFAHDNKNCIVLLNGAEEKHILKESYRKSRGLIVLDLISAKDSIKEWEKMDLNQIEPFTIILFYDNQLYQLQWNEFEKSSIKLDIKKSYIWSSSTLYEKKIRDERANWFVEFIESEREVTNKKLLDFHQFTQNNNKDYGLQINRNNLLKTISITQCIISKNNITFNYIDLLNQ